MDRRIEAILVALDQESPESWTIKALAESVALSASRLRHLFKQETGKSLAQQLKKARLRRAEYLLRTSFLTIKQIAEDAGHISGSHFSREFKKRFGTSPTAYRRRFGTHTKRQNR
jgi:AraC family transcriptional regulator of arabinose operon